VVDMHAAVCPDADKLDAILEAVPGNRQPPMVMAGWTDTPIGRLLLACTNAGLCLAEFVEAERLPGLVNDVRRFFGPAIAQGEHQHLEQARTEIADYFAGRLTRFHVPVVYSGTPFQQAVWRRLREVPYGKTLSYEGLARAVGVPKGQRAVGRANGQNRIAVIVPCHRVINKDGRTGGYGAHPWRKDFLLQLEQRFCPR